MPEKLSNLEHEKGAEKESMNKAIVTKKVLELKEQGMNAKQIADTIGFGTSFVYQIFRDQDVSKQERERPKWVVVPPVIEREPDIYRFRRWARPLVDQVIHTPEGDQKVTAVYPYFLKTELFLGQRKTINNETENIFRTTTWTLGEVYGINHRERS